MKNLLSRRDLLRAGIGTAIAVGVDGVLPFQAGAQSSWVDKIEKAWPNGYMRDGFVLGLTKDKADKAVPSNMRRFDNDLRFTSWY